MFLAVFAKKLYLSLLNLEIDFLTLKMTFKHENSTRNGLHSKNHMKMRYYTMFLALFGKNCIFAYLTLKLTFCPWK